MAFKLKVGLPVIHIPTSSRPSMAPTQKRVPEIQRPKNVYGSFYLRLGALCENWFLNGLLSIFILVYFESSSLCKLYYIEVNREQLITTKPGELNNYIILVFGLGTMIYSAIEIGLFLETSFGQVDESCRNYFATLRPFLQTIFVFVQMYFIFLNLKVRYLS